MTEQEGWEHSAVMRTVVGLVLFAIFGPVYSIERVSFLVLRPWLMIKVRIHTTKPNALCSLTSEQVKVEDGSKMSF